MAEIEIFGLLGSAGSGFVTGEAYAPTEGPDPTIEPYENQDIIENVPPELEKNEEGKMFYLESFKKTKIGPTVSGSSRKSYYSEMISLRF